MEDIFRFVMIRPPESIDQPKTIPMETGSDYQGKLLTSRKNEVPWPLMVRDTQDYIAGERFADELSNLTLFEMFNVFKQRLDKIVSTRDMIDLEKVIEEVFKRTPAALVARDEFKGTKEEAFDSLLAIFIIPEQYHYLVSPLTEIAKLIGLIEWVAIKDPKLKFPTTVQNLLDSTLLLPKGLFPIRNDQIYPVGVADLLVVKQHIDRYEPGEISHIENVLKGESKKHVLKHSLTTEQTDIFEVETTKETINELQTTERFELKTEIEKTIKEDLSLKTGLTMSAKYGDALQIHTNLDVAYNNSKTEATKAASTHAKEVTTRATTKVTERIREQRTLRTTEVIEDTNEHILENIKGPEHIIGVYQWVNKIYKLQVFNYGKRLLFDVTVPEPAAFLRDTIKAKQKSDRPAPEKPPVFDVTPFQLSETSSAQHYYGNYVKLYGAGTVEPPVELKLVITKPFSGATNSDELGRDNLFAADALNIDSGYELKRMTVRGMFNYKVGADPKRDDLAPIMNIVVGHHRFQNQKGVEWALGIEVDYTLDPNGADRDLIESRSIPIAIETVKIRDYTVAIELHCERKAETLERWKLATYNAILKAYQQRVSDFEEKLAALKYELDTSPLGPLGGNPDQNRRIERCEIKKSFLSLLTGRDLVTNQINDIKEERSTPLFPRINLDDRKKLKDDGAFVRFFEQAFEWEQVMYFFYPYFWGRKDTWYETALMEHEDPLFMEFLKAGSARVVVPVRPSFEADLKYYLLTDQIWGGGQVPEVTDKRYLPISEEIKESTGAPGNETPVGEAWEAKVPTTLVKLRKDGALPWWERKDPKTWEWTPQPKEP